MFTVFYKQSLNYVQGEVDLSGCHLGVWRTGPAAFTQRLALMVADGGLAIDGVVEGQAFHIMLPQLPVKHDQLIGEYTESICYWAIVSVNVIFRGWALPVWWARERLLLVPVSEHSQLRWPVQQCAPPTSSLLPSSLTIVATDAAWALLSGRAILILLVADKGLSPAQIVTHTVSVM